MPVHEPLLQATGGDMFVFLYGVVVFWDVDSAREKDLLTSLVAFGEGLLTGNEQESDGTCCCTMGKEIRSVVPCDCDCGVGPFVG